MRGEEQIRAAARDDQETANRNGFKPGWRRARLWELIEKLQEEYLEFLKAVEEADREAMRWEGSDLRWCVTMLQDHAGVLELEPEKTRHKSKLWGRIKCVFGRHTWISLPAGVYVPALPTMCFYCKKTKEDVGD